MFCLNLCKSIQKKARADLAPPPICHSAASNLSFQILHFFQIGFLTILVSVFVRHISGTVLGCCASLQNIFSQFWCLRCDIFEILATQANKHTACAQPHNSKIRIIWKKLHPQCSWPVKKQKNMENYLANFTPLLCCYTL